MTGKGRKGRGAYTPDGQAAFMTGLGYAVARMSPENRHRFLADLAYVLEDPESNMPYLRLEDEEHLQTLRGALWRSYTAWEMKMGGS